MPSRIQVLRRRAFERQGGLCWYCAVPMWLVSPDELPSSSPSQRTAERLRCTAEHLVPKSEGGRDTDKNVAAAYAHCNQTRHKRKTPPTPQLYRQDVVGRMAKGRWHQGWVPQGVVSAVPQA